MKRKLFRSIRFMMQILLALLWLPLKGHLHNSLKCTHLDMFALTSVLYKTTA
jgi:hypothetical protein